jgi:hypothetical protein
MKNGAPILLTLHDYRYQLGHWAAAARRFEWRTLVDSAYVLAASAICCLGFDVHARPWKGTRTTFLSERCARRLLARAGFVDISVEKTPKHFIVRARRHSR